jgi:hypothetical protein
MTKRKRLMRRLCATWKKSETLAIRLDTDADVRLELLSQRWNCSRGEVVRRLIKQVS